MSNAGSANDEALDLVDNKVDINLENIHEDDLCPICQLLLYDPVTTACNHTLCNVCMVTWVSISMAAPMVVVDVDEEPVPFDAVSKLEAGCPMCRTTTTTSSNAQRAAELKGKYPHTWAEREAEDQCEGCEDGVQTMTVYIGNRHRKVPPRKDDPAQNEHEWTFFVKPSPMDIVREVHVLLDPTFRENHLILQRPPYDVVRLGWDVFTVTASVVLKAGYSWVSGDAQDSPDGAVNGMLPLEWPLDFDGFGGKGSMGRCRLNVKHG
jgi:hypothetical protein